MSVRGPLVAECEGVSEEERADFELAWSRDRYRGHHFIDVGKAPAGLHRWVSWAFTCCGIAEYWVLLRVTSHRRPHCPVCDPVGARRSDDAALDALARDIIAAGPERVAVLLDVSQDGQPLGRLQHPDDKAEIERLRDRCARLDALADAIQNERLGLLSQVQELRAEVDGWRGRFGLPNVP